MSKREKRAKKAAEEAAAQKGNTEEMPPQNQTTDEASSASAETDETTQTQTGQQPEKADPPTDQQVVETGTSKTPPDNGEQPGAEGRATKKAKPTTTSQSEPLFPEPSGMRAPEKAYFYRDPGTGTWKGPILDLWLAKQAGGGTKAGYRPVWVWIDPITRNILDYVKPEEVASLNNL